MSAGLKVVAEVLVMELRAAFDRLHRAFDDLPRRVAEELQARQVAIRPDDAAVLNALAPAVAEAVGDAWWTVAELLRRAEAEPTLRAALPVADARALGRLFSRAEGGHVGAFRVERGKAARGGVRRRLVRCDAVRGTASSANR